jgi:hypothetical protein
MIERPPKSVQDQRRQLTRLIVQADDSRWARRKRVVEKIMNDPNREDLLDEEPIFYEQNPNTETAIELETEFAAEIEPEFFKDKNITNWIENQPEVATVDLRGISTISDLKTHKDDLEFEI